MPLVIRPATGAEATARDALTHGAWGAPLTKAQFLERERCLRAHPWSKHAMIVWLGVHDETGETMASCETFRMNALQGGAPAISYGIASVFTEEKHRGRGHASAVVRGAMEQLEKATPKTPVSFHLYSDVGAPIYERLGFKSLPSQEWLIPATAPIKPLAGITRARRLTEMDSLAPLLERYSWLEAELHVVPDLLHLDWHWERSRVYGRLLGRRQPRFLALAADDAYSVWMADYKHDILRALIFVSNRVDTAAAMIWDASQEAEFLGIPKMSLWHTPAAMPEGAADALRTVSGVALAPRDGELAMVRPHLALTEVPRALWV